MKRKLNVMVLIVVLLLCTYGDLCAQLLKNMKQIVEPEQDEELTALFKEMSKFTYAYCQKETYVEPQQSSSYQYKLISNRYNIIGVYESPTGTQAGKMVYERILQKNNVNFSDSTFHLSLLQNKRFDQDKAMEFFTSLDSFGFDQLDNQCLTRTRFPDPDHPGWEKMEVLSDTQSEFNFLFAHGKIRRVDSYLPEYIYNRHPEQSSCRGVYILCRNLFLDRIWK